MCFLTTPFLPRVWLLKRKAPESKLLIYLFVYRFQLITYEDPFFFFIFHFFFKKDINHPVLFYIILHKGRGRGEKTLARGGEGEAPGVELVVSFC